MRTLPDGTVVPSTFDIEPMGSSKSLDFFNNVALRQGEVRKVLYPTDPKNISKTVVEYSVAVQVRNGQGPATIVNYPNCQVLNLFGGISDKVRYTYRAQTKEPEDKKTVSDGSKVMVLCVNGELRRAFIVGGLNEDTQPEKEEDGHNLRFEFNGIRFDVNKDGELRVDFRGATKADGKLVDGADSDATGSTLVFDKTGGIKLFTSAGEQLIHLDRANKKIDMQVGREWNVNSDDTISMKASGQVTVTGQTCSIEMDERAFIRTSGLYVGDATDATVLGTTFRTAQQTMHQTMAPLLDSISTTITTAATNLQIAAGLHKVPVIGAVLGSVNLQIAATALNALSPLFSSLSASIKNYESGGPYLSSKNKSD